MLINTPFQIVPLWVPYFVAQLQIA